MYEKSEKEFDEENKIHPLSHPQKRIWYNEKINPGTSLYNINATIRILGPVEFLFLEKSINIFLKKNDGLRLNIMENDGQPYQYVRKFKLHKLDFFDFSKSAYPEDEFAEWVDTVSRTPLELYDNELFYFAIFKISDNDGGFLEKFHHIVSDGWSSNLIVQNVLDSYSKLCNYESTETAETEEIYSYLDFIEHEKEYLVSERFEKNKIYWNNKFSTIPESLFINKSTDIEGVRKTYALDIPFSMKIKKFLKDCKLSFNTFYISLFSLYLNKTTGHNDIVIGNPILNRSGKKDKNTFGMFTSTMPFRFLLDENDSFIANTKRMNDELKTCFLNQKYPYDLLVHDIGLYKKGYEGLFNYCINYYNTKINTRIGEYMINSAEHYNGCQAYSMQMIIKDWFEDGSLLIEYDYRKNEYTDDEIERMHMLMNNLIDYVITEPVKILKDICLLSDEEKQKIIYDFNDRKKKYPSDKTVVDLFVETARRLPEKTAIFFKDRSLTYHELDEKSGNLARLLSGKGVDTESLVGLMTFHSIETVVAIFAVLKAGGAYLPIDPEYPDDRIKFMIEDSGINIILTNCVTDDKPGFDGEFININDEKNYLAGDTDFVSKCGPQNLAYVIYTSGSTGTPKGAMIEHRGLTNYICWAKQVYTRGENETFPLYSSLSFDLTVTSVFTPLISGNTIAVYRDDEDEYVLYRIMKENKSTVVKLTPANLSLLKDMDNRNSSVKRFIVGGEDLKTALAKKIYESFGGDIDLYNEYGPTETVVGCMIYKYDRARDNSISVPIGIPADNVAIYLLDANLNPVPPGTPGEMYISGDGVARGYHNRPELTSQKFIADPFLKNTRMYKTGDLARMIDDGIIEYIGRIDHQVKIRGYRIEPGEIEDRLSKHESVKAAVVLDFENDDGTKFLCAYIVENSKTSPDMLNEYIKMHLPEYFIPQHYVIIDEIPLTPNGKVDRRSLKKPDFSVENTTSYVAPQNEKEKNLISVMQTILNIDKIGIKDNFIKLGGDSIKAIQISSRLKEKGYIINVKNILEHPVFEKMALFMDKTGENYKSFQGLVEGTLPLSPVMKWFFDCDPVEKNHFNQSVLLNLKHNVSKEEIESIIDELIRHHDALRLSYDPINGNLFYNNGLLDKKTEIKTFDLSNNEKNKRIESIRKKGLEVKSSFDITDGCLFMACLFISGKDRFLLITAHHIVIDGVSWRILLEDIASLLGGISVKNSTRLPEKTDSFKKWVEYIYTGGIETAKNESDYWQKICNLPFDFPIDRMVDKKNHSSKTETIYLDENKTNLFISKANEPYNTSTGEILIAALVKTVNGITGNNTVVLEMEGHGREEIAGMDIKRTVGWFTSIYPALFETASTEYDALIKTVKEQYRKIPNKGFNFGILKYLAKTIKYNRNTRYIRFNYFGEFDMFDGDIFSIEDMDTGDDVSKKNNTGHIFEINAIIHKGRLKITFTYNETEFHPDTIRNFIYRYNSDLNDIINHCVNKNTVEFTPSDFDSAGISQEDLENLLI